MDEQTPAAAALVGEQKRALRPGTPQCPVCLERLTSARARFCEACGAEMDPAATGSLPFRSTAALASTTAGSPCRHCRGRIGAEGYCDTCGLAALEPAAVDQRGLMAVATHRGRRHSRNEDAAALAVTADGWPVLVMADGVSRSPSPHLAASEAVHAAAEWLEERRFTGAGSMTGAVTAAHRAVRAITDDPARPATRPGAACTLVVTVATDREVHVANVGDTRAYLLHPSFRKEGAKGDEGPEAWTTTQLTVDDSVGHALTAWLGAEVTEPSLHLTAHPASADDVLLVCSDGLWNYAPDSAAIGRLAANALEPPPAGTPPGIPPSVPAPSPVDACARLVSWAIDRGGADNVSVALARIPATPGQAATPRRERRAREEQHDHQ